MIIACSLVNLTTWEQARPAFNWLRARFDGPEDLAACDPAELVPALRPLGLYNRRSRGLQSMAHAWMRTPPARAIDVLALPGCGKYAHDSWAIFVDGRSDVTPDDGKLNWYVERTNGGPG